MNLNFILLEPHFWLIFHFQKQEIFLHSIANHSLHYHHYLKRKRTLKEDTFIWTKLTSSFSFSLRNSFITNNIYFSTVQNNYDLIYRKFTLSSLILLEMSCFIPTSYIWRAFADVFPQNCLLYCGIVCPILLGALDLLVQ